MTTAPPTIAEDAGLGRWLAAWGVHLFTASGAVIALLALEAIYHGHYDRAFGWMALALAIDCADGTLARVVRVKAVLPRFDGTRLDDLIDYLNYTVVPVVLIYAAERLPPSVDLPVAAAVLVASAYGFCQADAKTSDGYFKGFPSYWNVVVFYLFALDTPPWFTAAALITFAVLVFVPIYYVYPSRAPRARTLTITLGIVWAVSVLIALARLPEPPHALLLGSLSVYLTLHR
jgi:phosphatidylcholine synthase